MVLLELTFISYLNTNEKIKSLLLQNRFHPFHKLYVKKPFVVGTNILS